MDTSNGTKPTGFHYGYLILLSCIAFCLGPCALVLSCAGIFFKPVATTLGIGVGMTSYYMTALFAGSIIMLPIWGKLMQTKDVRMVTTAGALIIGLAFFLLSFVNSYWQFLACGFIIGLAIPVMIYLATPVLINRWFAKRAGFFIGIAMAFTGIGGVIFNPIGGYLINTFGWQFAYRIFAIINLVIALPFSIFVVRSNPVDKGLLPLGFESDSKNGASSGYVATGLDASEVFHSKIFYILLGWVLLLGTCMYGYQMTAAYVGTMSIAASMPMLASTAASFAMAGQTTGKILFGALGDKSVRNSIIAALSCGIVALVGYQVLPQSTVTIFVCAFLIGAFASFCNVLQPIMTRAFFGTREYSTIYARISMVQSLGSALQALIWGTLVDATGGWTVTNLGQAVVMLVGIFVIVLIFSMGKDLPKKWHAAKLAEDNK